MADRIEGLQSCKNGSVKDATITTLSKDEPINYGITDPVCFKTPSQKDLQLTEQLETVLRQRGLYETEEGLRNREEVLELLSKLLCEWVGEIYLEQTGHDPISPTQALAHIFTSGSYRLGVVTPEGDIDAICVVPNYVTREAFFTSFFAKLQQDPSMEKVQALAETYTPIIKLECRGIDVDLLLARLALAHVPADISALRDDSVLKAADEKTVRSLNGCRVAEDILRLVPNVENMIMTLRFVKYWAKQRGIDSNVLGFFGGVSWALLVARVCQLYPCASPSQLIHKFFLLFSIWDWTQPILLCPIVEHRDDQSLNKFHVWNPVSNPQDRYHLMPIVTPSFPSMNSTHNVTLTTRQIIISEFERGLNLMTKIRKGHAGWDAILEPLDFFTLSDHYLEFIISASTALLFDEWSGWVKSKLRILIKKLEAFPMLSVRAWPHAIPLEPQDDWRRCAIYFGVYVDPAFPEPFLSVSGPMVEFMYILLTQYPIHAVQDCIDMSVSHFQQANLPDYVKKYMNCNSTTCSKKSEGVVDSKAKVTHGSNSDSLDEDIQHSPASLKRQSDPTGISSGIDNNIGDGKKGEKCGIETTPYMDKASSTNYKPIRRLAQTLKNTRRSPYE